MQRLYVAISVEESAIRTETDLSEVTTDGLWWRHGRQRFPEF
jgi:hypothetical protein